MKTIILHIGANKTGSTAIQEFLRHNAEALPRFGLTVAPTDLSPRGQVTGQHVWLIEQLLNDIPAGRKRILKRLDRLMNGIAEGAGLVISAENLANPDGAERMFAGIADKFDVRVVLYIRRQDEYLLSSWQQWESKVKDDFWAWLIQGVGTLGDWQGVLQAWEQIVPRDRITVRLYERARLPQGDVIADFAQAVGLSDHLSAFSIPETISNPSYSGAVMDLVKGNPLLFRDKHDRSFYSVVDELTGIHYHRNPRDSFITHEQRGAILDRYRDSNAWVQEHYFLHPDGPLFTPPTPDEYVVLGKDELEARKWEFVASMIFRIAKRVLG